MHCCTQFGHIFFINSQIKQYLTNILSAPGFLRDSQEEVGLLEAAGPQTTPPVPPESNAGHARVPPERVGLRQHFPSSDVFLGAVL